MSTDMAISLSKKFIRQISQPFDHTQTGISLWTLEDIEAKQERAQREYGEAFGTVRTPALAIEGYEGMDLDEAVRDMPPAETARAVDLDMDYGELDDEALMAMDMPE
jgi:DNA excision repair protein ERCC-2